MNIPVRPVSGKAIPQGWHGQLWDWVQSMNVSGDKKTIFVKETSLGKMLSGKPFSQEQSTGNPSGGSSSFTLFEVVKKTDTSIKINGYNPEEKRYWANWMTFGKYTVELEDGVTVSVSSSGVIYLEATTAGGLNDWVVTPKFASELPVNSATKNIHYLADVTVIDGKISNIEQPPTGVIAFPTHLESYDVTKKMTLIVDNGIYKWIEIGDCNA